MRTAKYILPATELLLIFPAVLFMSALFVRNVQPLKYEPAHTAQQIVLWYSARPRVGLWLLLIALPFTVLVTGCATSLRRWSRDTELRGTTQAVLKALRSQLAPAMVALATVLAGGVLAVVALHIATD